MTGIYFLPVRPVEREASSLFAALRRPGQESGQKSTNGSVC
jgi:hypothetical protein